MILITSKCESLLISQHVIQFIRGEGEPDQHPTSMADPTHALVTEREQIPAARWPNLVNSLPERVEAVIVAF